MCVERRWALAIAVAVGLSGAAPAVAQAPSFPDSLQREPLLLWLHRETDIQPDRVVAVTAQALTSIVSVFPAGASQGPRVVIRAEALDAETHARTGALSWHVSISADCAARRLRLGETTGYPERNLLGERRLLRPAETAWRAPDPGTALENAWRAACERDFRGPLQGAAVRVARADTTPPPAEAASPEAPAPAPAPAPVPVKPRAPRAGGGTVVQVGASTSESEAKALLANLGSRIAGRPSWVETAQVGGKTWRRAVVGGFADRGEASRFCAALTAAGRACFLRAGGPG